MLRAHSREEFGRLSLHVIDNLYSLVLECQCFQQFTSLDKRELCRVSMVQTEQIKNVKLNSARARPKVLQEIKIRPSVFIDSDQLAVHDSAGWQIGKRVCNIRKFTVEGFLRPGIEIYPVGLDGNRSVTVDFYFPS